MFKQFDFTAVEAPHVSEYLKSDLRNSLGGSLHGLSQAIRGRFGMGFGLPMRNAGLNFLMYKLRQHLFPNLGDNEAQTAFVTLFNEFLEHAEKLNKAIEVPLQKLENENRELIRKCQQNISLYHRELNRPAQMKADLEAQKERKKKELQHSGLDQAVIEQALNQQFKIWQKELEDQLKNECKNHAEMRRNLEKMQEFVKTLDKSLLEGIQL